MAIYVPWLIDAARLAANGAGKSVIAQPGGSPAATAGSACWKS
jgi:hypothetical protein